MTKLGYDGVTPRLCVTSPGAPPSFTRLDPKKYLVHLSCTRWGLLPTVFETPGKGGLHEVKLERQVINRRGVVVTSLFVPISGTDTNAQTRLSYPRRNDTVETFVITRDLPLCQVFIVALVGPIVIKPSTLLFTVV